MTPDSDRGGTLHLLALCADDVTWKRNSTCTRNNVSSRRRPGGHH